MNNMKKIKLEAIKKDITLTKLAFMIGISRENMYHHIKKKNHIILKKIEKILDLEENSLSR